MKKPLNISVPSSVKERAAKLAEQYGDGSISNLFERLVAEEFDRDSVPADTSSWSKPDTWKAMLATMPLAEAPFRALVDSPLARAAFRKAIAPEKPRRKK